MTYKSYKIMIEEDGEFDRSFIRYAIARHRAAARLTDRLEAFAADRSGTGVYLRGAGTRSIFVVPSPEALDDDGEPGLLALVDDDARTVCPLRFLPPRKPHDWKEYIDWAEAYLGI